MTQLESLPKLGRLNLGGPWQAVQFANFLPVFPGMLSRLHTLELGFFPLSFADSNRLRAMTHLKGFGICLVCLLSHQLPSKPVDGLPHFPFLACLSVCSLRPSYKSLSHF